MNDTLVAGFLENVGELLSVAIRTGNAEEAASLISRLSTLKLNINISIRKEESEKHSDEQEFSVKVHVEDRISDGCFFNLLVKSSDTIKDLKTKVMLKYNFPVEVQKWIIGKKIPDDGNKLSQCGVKGPGHVLYLYLVTARSVGLSRQDHEARRHSQQNEVQGSQDQHSQTLLLLREPNWPADATTVQLLCDHHSPTPTFSPPTVTEDMIGNLYGPARQSSKRSLSSGSSFLYDMVMDPNQPSGVSIVKNSQNSVCESGGNEQNDTRISPPRPISVLGVRTSTTPPPNHEKLHWQCPMCTYLNLPMRPGCEMCSSSRPQDYKIPPGYQVTAEERLLLENDQRLERMTREVQEQQAQDNYLQLRATDELAIISNTEPFQCPICFDDIDVAAGIVLRECLHMFCRDCLMSAVMYCDDAILKCPFQDGSYTCQSILQEREVRALVPVEIYRRYLQRGLDQAESQLDNSYHCKTANCTGWCIYEDLVNFFKCPVCQRENCLTCKAIHEDLNCKQYQDDLKLKAKNDTAAKQTAELLQNLVANGEAMMCPKCRVVLQKKGGCDWIKCSFCKTEICWVTKGPRWGPLGEGDISGGCRCKVNGKKCSPNCLGCH